LKKKRRTEEEMKMKMKKKKKNRRRDEDEEEKNARCFKNQRCKAPTLVEWRTEISEQGRRRRKTKPRED